MFIGYDDDPLDPPCLPGITVRSKKEGDGEIYFRLDLNHARELYFRLRRLIEACSAIKQAKEEKTIAPVA